jgi:eukaryotic-like serine/threonine-protein kinase
MGTHVIGIGTTLKERFLLEKELGRGGMGAVYSATDQVLLRSVAIKVLKDKGGEEVGKRLRLEAQIAARLLHENVVRIYDFGQADGTSFLIMEQVDGTSYSRRWRHLPIEDRLRILAQVAEAMDYAHHQGVVHRDIKPGNVLLTAADSPKLTDFGLSILIEQGDDSGIVRGTPLYMSPEQTRGSQLDFRSDLYSLGVMIYESTTGAAPFTGSSMAIMSQHATATPAPPRSRNPALSPDLEATILSLLAKRPDDRPRSGSAVAEVLRREADRIARERPAGEAAPSGPAAPPPSATVSMPAGPTATRPARPSGSESLPADGTAPGPGSDRAASMPEDAPDLTMPGSLAATVSVPKMAPVTAPAAAAARPAASRPIAATGGATLLVRSPLVRRMLEAVLSEPILLSPEERYLTGHYLAYLLGGSRRRGLFLRRPMEPRNADRARLLLGMTYATMAGPTEEAIRDAAALLDQRIDVRAALSPVVVAKYLVARSSPPRRRLFRQTRKAVAEASAHAQKKMVDAKGILNPGLMPQRLEDLQKIAPPRTEVDDVLVERWNRVAEVWRTEPRFREAVLRYAARGAYRDPAGMELWPEVIYALIERARWQRRGRSRAEALWDYLCGRILHIPDAGVELDRALARNVPAPLVAQLDDSFELMADIQKLEDEEADPFAQADADDRLAASISMEGAPVGLAEIAAEPDAAERNRGVVRLADPNPLRFLQGELHELWKEALAALQQAQLRPGAKPPSHRHVPIGPYRLTVIPSIRGRAAGTIAIQGMGQKQIELTTPTVRTKGSAGKPLVAIWVYCDSSLVIAHLDFRAAERFVLWHAPRAHQLNFDDPADLNHELFSLGMEVPDQLDKVLSRWFRPRKTV